MNNFIKFIAFFMLLSKPAFGFKNFDECKHLTDSILENSVELSLGDQAPWVTKNNHGVEFEYLDIESIPAPIGISSVYLQRRLQNDYTDEDWDLFLNGTISSINGLDSFALSADEVKAELSKSELQIAFEEHDLALLLEKNDFNHIEIIASPYIRSIGDINPKDGQIYADIVIDQFWRDPRLLTYARETYRLGTLSDQNAISEEYTDTNGFLCKVSADFLKEIEYLAPELEVHGFIPEINHPTKYQLYYSIEDDEESFGIFSSKRHQGNFENSFDLKKFPFDSQDLTWFLSPKDQDASAEGHIAIVPSELAIERLETTYIQFDDYSWNATGYNYQNGTTWSDVAEARLENFYFEISVQRKLGYYFIKLLLPVTLLLVLTWSIFWIPIKEMETRITISIVTFLALIAYNFVIDGELPKLAYVTFIDAFILISYVFAAFPTFLTIICKNYSSAERIKLAERINQQAKFIVPCSYIILVQLIGAFYRIL